MPVWSAEALTQSASMLSPPPTVVSDAALTGYNGSGIINSGADCIYFKALRRGAWGRIVFPSKHCRGALNTVQPRAQTTAVMETQSISPSRGEERVLSFSHDEELTAYRNTFRSLFTADPSLSAHLIMLEISF